MRIGIWRRRVAADSEDFIYGIGDFRRHYHTIEDATEAMTALIEETVKYPQHDATRAYLRLQKAGHRLFQNK